MVAAVPGPVGTAAAQESRPNILLIITDDQRDDGTMRIMKETRRWMKRGGVTFRNAYATTPQCCPSRASIMTGRYAHNHGVENNTQGENLDHSTTMQRYLHDVGYQTAIYGKFINGWDLTQAPPHFDNYGLFHGGYIGYIANVDGAFQRTFRYSTDFFGDLAGRQVRRWEATDDQPWLMFVTVWAPHTQSIPKRRLQSAKVGPFKRNPAMRERDCSDKPATVNCWYNKRKRNRLRKDQLRTLITVDSMVADLRKELKRAGEMSDTLVFFLSDNGYLWGEHGLTGKKPPYRGSIDIPMFMRFPGRVEKSTTDHRMVANIDIAPTIYDAAGVDPQIEIDGRSLLDDSWVRDRLLLELEESKQWPRWASTLTQDHQYTEYYNQEGVLTFREFYDRHEDPWQLLNLLGDSDVLNDPDPATQAALNQQLMEDRSCSGNTCP